MIRVPMRFRSSIGRNIEEESRAVQEYEILAMSAESLGLFDVADTLRGISDDENRHAQVLRGIHRRLTI